MTAWQDRTIALIGENAMTRLKSSCVCVFGLGGVGSYVVEALARCGVGKIIVVDNDKVAKSNINRQLYALHSTVGSLKVDVCEKRVKDINPEISVVKYPLFFDGETASKIDLWGVDYIVDAIDSIKSKVLLCQLAKSLNKPIISSFGTGNKLDNTGFKVADVYETKVCPLAKVMRKELKAVGIESLKVVYSEEEPKTKVSDRIIPSISFVPSTAGLIIAGEVIKDLIGIENAK